MATILYPDGSTQEVQPANGSDFTLHELQAVVGGLIEIVRLRDRRRIMVVNEEGKLLGLPRNDQATRVAELPTVEERWAMIEAYRKLGMEVIEAFAPDEEDYLAGTVLLCKNSEVR